jgi:signal peptidase I
MVRFSARRSPRRLGLLLTAGALLAGVASCLPWRIGIVTGASMTPTLQPGQLFLYQRTAPGAMQLQPGEIVVVRHNGETWVKRVFATGGHRFWTWTESQGEDRYHYPIERASRERFTRLAQADRARFASDAQVVRLTIPQGRLFVVGDSATSVDSRTLGPVNEEEVLGRLIPLPGQRLGTFSPWIELSFTVPKTPAELPAG